jgi:hypothetical protein
METAELTRGFTTQAETELSEMARSLAVVATLAIDYPKAVQHVSRGFTDLAALAQACGKARICMASRALATVLDRLDRAPEGDAPFILDTVVTFLETIHSANDWRSRTVAI